jgi:hypothetical protein
MPTTPAATATVDPATIRTALLELLSGRDHGAAAPDVLAEIGTERRRQAAEHDARLRGPLGDTDRLAVLVAAIGPVATAVHRTNTAGRAPDALRAGLIRLAAITLSWLDPALDPPVDPWADEPPF